MEWRKWADLLNVLKDDNNSSLYVFYFEYTSYLLNIQRYYLGTMESICKRYWTEYDPNLTIEELLNKIKRKLSYKGFNAVRKVQLLDPWIGYHQYYYDWQHRDRSTFSKMEEDIDIKSKAKWLISHNLNLASIHGEVIGIGGMLYTERKYLHETGNRSYPYLYFVQGTDVAEITVESNPRFVRGYIKEEYVEGVTKWIKDNLVVLERYWNKEIGSSELLKEVCSLDGKHCFCPKK